MRRVDIPCGYCVGCRLRRSREWAVRCMHEAQTHAVSSFVTLTYDEEHYTPSLNYSDFQRFMKRLRKTKGAVRFFMCGEYGSETNRPHFHALLFGAGFAGLSPVRDGLFRSPELEKLWPNGFSSIGAVTYESAGYVARYSLKKVCGVRAADHYRRVDLRSGEIVDVEPEFAHMSLKPGIGFEWFKKYWKEVHLARDGVVLRGGRSVPVPRYYDARLADFDPDLREWRDFTRYENSKAFLEHTTPERLAARELCALADLSTKKRAL